MKVFVYYNLHKHCWSVKALTGENKGRVIRHAAVVTLRDVVGKVSEAGRQRVLKEKKKNVHAGIVGTLVSTDTIPPSDVLRTAMRPITYNPYKYTTFVDKSTEEAFEGGSMAFMYNRQVFVPLNEEN